MRSPGCLALFTLVAIIVLPFFYAEIMVSAMSKLAMPPNIAFLAVFGVILGSVVNIPVRKIERNEEFRVDQFHMYGIDRFFPGRIRRARFTIIAVNLGGCVIPMSIAVFEIFRIATVGTGPLAVLILVAAANVLVCYFFARPVKGVGIVMPTLIPPLVAALGAILLLPDFAPPVAFAAGVLGPLVGADLLHLKDIQALNTGIASIGGAGTFDGIVLSAVIATFLA
ncbi:MAG: DUF1614 domain-containing protein [Acidobacteriota bacterium]